MSTSFWRSKSREVIAAAVAEGHLTYNLSDVALARFIGDRYPFAPGDVHARRVWLDELRKHLDALKPRPAAPAGGATPLFDREKS